MPLYNPTTVEYTTASGHIHIAMEDGTHIPAYWAHPHMGSKLPAIGLLHDWWGMTPVIRRMAMLFAQMGYYVIVPDLFDGKVTNSAKTAMELVKNLGDQAFPRFNAALAVLEHHHQSNRQVAAIGIGMGGSLAYEAAIRRADLEAAVSFYGFPQRYLGRFKDCNTPILAFYPSDSPFIPPALIKKLESEFAASTLADCHEIVTLQGVSHGFISDTPTNTEREIGPFMWTKMQHFLEQHLGGPAKPPERKQVY